MQNADGKSGMRRMVLKSKNSDETNDENKLAKDNSLTIIHGTISRWMILQEIANVALRGFFLSFFGPIIGTSIVLLICPLLTFGLLMGWSFWLFAYGIGGLPSVLTAISILAFRWNGNPGKGVYPIAVIVAAISTIADLAAIDLVYSAKPGQLSIDVLLMVLIPAMVSACALCWVDEHIL